MLEEVELKLQRLGGAAQGTQTAALAAGGYDTAAVDTSEEYNGTSWSEGEELNTARPHVTGTGSQTAGLMFGKNPAGGDTEEYNGTSWTAAEAMNASRSLGAGAGSQISTVAMSGNPPAGTGVATEDYDGTDWATGENVGTGRQAGGGFGIGTGSAGIAAGYNSPPGILDICEEYTGAATAKSITSS